MREGGRRRTAPGLVNAAFATRIVRLKTGQQCIRTVPFRICRNTRLQMLNGQAKYARAFSVCMRTLLSKLTRRQLSSKLACFWQERHEFDTN